MKYFDSGVEIKGGCYHEFIKGTWNGQTYWSNDSLILDDDILNGLNVGGLFASVVPSYDPYGPTGFTVGQWKSIREKAGAADGELELLISELDGWLGSLPGDGIAFTILGV